MPRPQGTPGPIPPPAAPATSASPLVYGGDLLDRPPAPEAPAPTLSAGLVGSPTTVLDTARLEAAPRPVPAAPSFWQRLWTELAKAFGARSRSPTPPPPQPVPPHAVARAVIPELAPGTLASAEVAARAHAPLVRPTLATLAFAARARVAWQKAAAEPVPTVRSQHIAEGVAWAERATRAARSLQRALPPPTDDDRALRALLRTALGALQDVDPTRPVALQALQQLEQAVHGLGQRLGIPLADPLGPSGRSDVPGFLARITHDKRKTVLGVLAFAIPAIAFGLLYLALAG